jgi:hypothetical protein
LQQTFYLPFPKNLQSQYTTQKTTTQPKKHKHGKKIKKTANETTTPPHTKKHTQKKYTTI